MPTDIEKTADNKGGKWLVRGYASKGNEDLQHDIIPPEAINADYFSTDGYLNYEHIKGPEAIIGVPTENTHVDEKGLYVEGELIKSNKYAQQFFDLAMSLKKSGIKRKLGFSIEGVIKKRDDADPRIIRDVVITNVALTTHPANQEARFDAVIKSLNDKYEQEHVQKDETFTTGTGITPDTQEDAASLRPEDFARHLKVLTYGFKLKGAEQTKFYRQVAKSLDEGDFDLDLATVFLQISKGYSRQESASLLNRIYPNNE